jgi:putative flippase GtrA
MVTEMPKPIFGESARIGKTYRLVSAQFGRLARFLVVGGVTLLINSLLLAFWTDVVGIYYLISAALATEGATICGFCLTEFWVFAGRRSRQGRGRRFVIFLLMNNAVLVLRSPLMYALTTRLGLHYLISNALSIVVLTLIRYLLADAWIWKNGPGVENRLSKAEK